MEPHAERVTSGLPPCPEDKKLQAVLTGHSLTQRQQRAQFSARSWRCRGKVNTFLIQRQKDQELHELLKIPGLRLPLHA